MSGRSWGTIAACLGLSLGAALGCGEDALADLDEVGTGCRANESGRAGEVRFHVFNVNDVPGIRVVLTKPQTIATCIIDPLPTSTSSGIELGQWLTTGSVGTVVNIEVSITAGTLDRDCAVNQSAFESLPPGAQAGQTFIDVSVVGQSIDITCAGGLDPA